MSRAGCGFVGRDDSVLLTVALYSPTMSIWDSLLHVIDATGAERIGVTGYGYIPVVVRYLREKGKDAFAIETHFSSDSDDNAEGIAALSDEGEGAADA